MGVLILLVGALVVAGCYAPTLRDCTVRCEAASDCAAGQMCGDDRLCAAPEIAGQCADRLDAGMPSDAGIGDTSTPDTPTTVALRVQVMGKGSVVVDGHGTCSSKEPQRGDCVYDIALARLQRVRAVPIELDEVFEKWASKTCSEQGAICTFTPLGPTEIAAKFVHAD